MFKWKDIHVYTYKLLGNLYMWHLPLVILSKKTFCCQVIIQDEIYAFKEKNRNIAVNVT